jgi:hypothetical protein
MEEKNKQPGINEGNFRALVDKANERIVVFVGNVDVSLASVKMHRTTIFPDT